MCPELFDSGKIIMLFSQPLLQFDTKIMAQQAQNVKN